MLAYMQYNFSILQHICQYCYNAVIKERMWNMSAKEIVKIMLVKRAITVKILAEKMSEYTGQKYTQSSLASKISRGTLRYDEVEIIAKILDFKITIE